VEWVLDQVRTSAVACWRSREDAQRELLRLGDALGIAVASCAKRS